MQLCNHKELFQKGENSSLLKSVVLTLIGNEAGKWQMIAYPVFKIN